MLLRLGGAALATGSRTLIGVPRSSGQSIWPFGSAAVCRAATLTAAACDVVVRIKNLSEKFTANFPNLDFK
jgi:hypothetical protein